jgi:hypothetical protein
MGFAAPQGPLLLVVTCVYPPLQMHFVAAIENAFINSFLQSLKMLFAVAVLNVSPILSCPPRLSMF